MAAYKRDSLVRRVIDFLQANPGEELARRDIAVKFGVEPAAIDSLLAPAVRGRKLLMTAGAEDGVVWKLAYPPSKFPSSLASHARRTRRAMIDLSTVVIEKGIPLVQPARRVNQWAAIFDKMQPGDRFALPIDAHMALAHAQTNYRKTAAGVVFAIRKISSTQTRIWRTA